MKAELGERQHLSECSSGRLIFMCHCEIMRVILTPRRLSLDVDKAKKEATH